MTFHVAVYTGLEGKNIVAQFFIDDIRVIVIVIEVLPEPWETELYILRRVEIACIQLSYVLVKCFFNGLNLQQETQNIC